MTPSGIEAASSAEPQTTAPPRRGKCKTLIRR